MMKPCDHYPRHTVVQGPRSRSCRSGPAPPWASPLSAQRTAPSATPNKQPKTGLCCRNAQHTSKRSVRTRSMISHPNPVCLCLIRRLWARSLNIRTIIHIDRTPILRTRLETTRTAPAKKSVPQQTNGHGPFERTQHDTANTTHPKCRVSHQTPQASQSPGLT